MSQLTGNFLAGYCDPVVSSSGDAGIAQVVLANTDGSAEDLITTQNTNNSGYEDFTSSVGSALVEVGSSYNLSAYINTNGGYNYHTKAWVDWNKDGDFGDANEEYDLGENTSTLASASSLSPLALTVPVSATVGTNFIRIGTKFNTDPTSCASDYGEFEDYALNVTAACSAPSTQASSLTFSDQASTSQTLSWTRGNGNNVMVVAKAGSSSSDPTNGTLHSKCSIWFWKCLWWRLRSLQWYRYIS